MEFEIFRNGEKLRLTDNVNPALPRNKNFPVAFTASGSWGNIVYEINPASEISIFRCSYIIYEDSIFTIKGGWETIGLHVAYKNIIDCDPHYLSRLYLKQGQLSITYLSQVDSVARFQKGEYITFDISYPKSYFSKFAPYITGIAQFLINIDRTQSCHLNSPIYADSKMLSIINEILGMEALNPISNLYLDAKGFELLLLALTKMGKEKTNAAVLKRGDISRLQLVKEYIDKNFADVNQVADLAKQFGLNEFKLRAGFKELFGQTVNETIIAATMNKAADQLKNSDLTITEIAYIAGYSSLQSFTRAFTQKFGMSPSEYRRDS